MTGWRPPKRVRVVAIGTAWRSGQLFAFKVTEDSGKLKGLRPPGGGVEFGERTQDALRREMREELDTEIDIEGPPVVLENLFTHDDAPGHEIIFAYPVRFLNQALYAQDQVTIHEDNGDALEAAWIDFEAFVTGALTLFPDGLLAALRKP